MYCLTERVSAYVPAVPGVRTAVLVIALFFWLGTGQAALADRFIDYLYVEANEGDSSGGHAAIRFGSETFHFQHESPGILRIRRHDAAAFHHAYAMLGNRSIRESRIAVSDDTYTLLRDAFVRLLLVQDGQLSIREALRRDVTLFESLLRQRRDTHSTTDEIVVTLDGVGYFLPDTPSTLPGTAAGTSSPALVSLRNRIRAVYGQRFIAERIARTRSRIQGLELQAAESPMQEISRDSFPHIEPSVSTRYRDNLYALFALELLQAAPQILPETYWATDAGTFRLEPDEVLALKTFARQLETDLIHLLASTREDWGQPFVLGMARLVAIETSLASGRLVLLDIFARDSHRPPRHDAALRPYLPMMEREMREVFLRKRKEFFTGDTFREADYAAMERSGNFLLDIDRAMATGSALRERPETPFPSRAARLGVPPPGRPEEAALAWELAAARAAERDYAAALDRLYAYDLVSRNCVTEIFAVINKAITPHPPDHGRAEVPSDPAAPLLTESEKRLGGFVDASRGLDFIPFVSAGTVESSYAVTAVRDLPSYRTARLAEMREHEAALAVFLRESNTITSTVYRPGPDDSAFIFFTDDVPLLRPLFGAFNLLAGFGEGVLGIVTLPVEGPERLLSGTRGVLFSLPELVFVNLRKGSMAYVEQSPEK